MTFQYQVFRTWWDHLKYDLKFGRVMGWVPRWIVRNLKIEYMTVTKKIPQSPPEVFEMNSEQELSDWLESHRNADVTVVKAATGLPAWAEYRTLNGIRRAWPVRYFFPGGVENISNDPK